MPLSPTRVLDTRNGTGTGTAAKLASDSTLTVLLSSRVPATASAVVMNVTATNPTADGYLTVYPAGQSRPLASHLNTVAGMTVANLTTAGLGTDLGVSIYNSSGSVDVVADLAGYFMPAV